MTTVAKLIEELKKFPPDALVEAYEGEDTGLFILDHGFIPCRPPSWGMEDGETSIFKGKQDDHPR